MILSLLVPLSKIMAIVFSTKQASGCRVMLPRAEKIERAADVSILMHSHARFRIQNSTDFNDKTKVCSTHWLTLIKGWCVLSPGGRIRVVL